MAEVPRPDEMSSCEKSYRVDEVRREHCYRAPGKSVLHLEWLQRSGICNENPVWNRDGGVFIQLHKRGRLP
jgi:hypothetical protein